MPDVNSYDNENDWMAACVPAMTGEGRDQEQAVAACMSMWRDKKSMDDFFIARGDIAFATKTKEGVKFGGYLIRFGDPNNTDLTGDFFTPNTDFGDAKKSDGWFHHRMPLTTYSDRKGIEYREQIGDAYLRKDNYGIFAEMIVNARNEYEKGIIDAGLAGKLGWSSGTAAHLVDRKEIAPGIYEITKWPLGLDASLTPTPAEPRNTVVPIKSLLPVAGDAKENNAVQTKSLEENEMDEKQIADMVAQAAATAAEQAVKKYADSIQPEVKAGFVTDVKDESDRALEGNPFKSAGDFFMSVKNAALAPHAVDKRLLPLKATGANEAIPSQGGFLVTQDISNNIWELMHPTGSLLSLVNAIPVQGNGLVVPAIDESSRADGSRMGGIQAYWLNEGGTYTATKPKFRTIDIKLNKLTALTVATDELLEDARALESWLMSNVPNELRFQIEAAIFLGDGVGKPLGVTASPALLSINRNDANEIDAEDIGDMWAHRWAGYNDYVWLANPVIFPQLMTMSISNEPVYVPPSGLDAAPYGSLLGRPVIENEYSRTLGSIGDLMLFSPSAYALITKGGVKSEASIHVYFSTGEQAFRFTQRVGGQPYWVSALTSYASSSDTFSPFVALTSS